MFVSHFGLTSSDWEKVRIDLYKTLSEGQLVNICETLFWRDSENVFDFSALASRILFIYGLRDEIFQISNTEELGTDLLKPSCILKTLPSNHIALRDNKKVAQYLKVFISN